MGEDIYNIFGKEIIFSDGNDEFMCLCTFPQNDQEHLDIERLRSLALFGAVVRLVFEGYYKDVEDYIYIPEDVPEWILQGIREVREQKTSE